MQNKMPSSKTTGRGMRPLKALAVGALATTLGACTTSFPATATGLRDVAGDTVPGAQGLTLTDQDRIDAHVARMCAAGVYTREACARHTVASRDRRAAPEAGA